VGILVLELEENGGEKFLDKYKVEYIISKVVLGARKDTPSFGNNSDPWGCNFSNPEIFTFGKESAMESPALPASNIANVIHKTFKVRKMWQGN
jgi:hypothetical protein